MDHKKKVVQCRKPQPVQFIATRHFSFHQRI